MEPRQTAKDKNPKKYSHLKLEDLGSFIKHLEALLDELLPKASRSPKEDKKGNSECPFAGEPYPHKEEAVEMVLDESQELRPYLELVKEEVERCRKNLEQIRVDEVNLELYETKEKYDFAREAQQQELDHFIGLKNTLIDLLIRKDELLKMAGEERHKWPIGKPTRQDHFDPKAVLEGVLDGTYAAMLDAEHVIPQPSRPSVNAELNALLSLGPIGSKGIYSGALISGA